MKNSKLKLALLILPLTLVLTGCGQTSVEYGGIWNFIVLFFARTIVFFGHHAFMSLGMGIIITTLVIRLLLAPIYGKQIKLSEETKKLQPKINALNKKYENKKDQASQMKKAQEQQAIYKEAGVNPMAGCLPLLLQFPILIAFYSAIRYLVPDQATIDMLTKNGESVIYGLQELNAEDLNQVFFGFDLANPVIIFAILAAITTFLTTYISTIGQDKDAPGASVIKYMMIIMPAMILFIGMSLPGALSIYWVVGNLFSIAQTLYFKRSSLQTNRQKKNIMNSK